MEGKDLPKESDVSPFGASAVTQFFYELTPERVLDAVERFGFRATGRCFALNSMENRVYQVEIEPHEAAGSAQVVAKFYRPGRWNREQILEEHTYLQQLQECDVPVVPPLNDSHGHSLIVAPDLEILCAIFPRRGGRQLDELDEEQLLQVGRLLARMHEVGSVRPFSHRLQLKPQVYLVQSLEHLQNVSAVPHALSGAYSDVVQSLNELVAPLFEATQNQRIHGDCHLGNILWNVDGPLLVDFDDAVNGPPAQDLWLLTGGRDAEANARLEVMLRGYEQMRPSDRRSLRLIEALRAMRMVYFSAWISRRWSDPAFPRAFEYFGTERYWHEQYVALREQLQLLQAQSLAAL